MNEQKSFTLIELLVVIVIIGILAGVIMISTSSSIDKANIAKLKVFSESIKNNLMIDLVSEWKLDEGSGTIIKDSWGNNNGTLTNGVWNNENSCISGNCLGFNTNTDYVTVPSDESLRIVDNLTLEAWVNPTDWQENGVNIINNSIYRFYHRSGNNIHFFYRIQEAVSPCDSAWSYWTGLIGYVSENSFHHVIGVMEGTYMKLYVDGVLVRENGTCFNGYTKSPSSMSDMIFGFTTNNNKGILDEVKVYSQAITSLRVKQNYIAGLNSLLSQGSISKENYSQRINVLAYNEYE